MQLERRLRLLQDNISLCYWYGITPAHSLFIRLKTLQPPHAGTHEFVNEVIGCQELKAWRLRDIMISRPSCCGNLTLWNLMHLFTECIPTISSFAETGTVEIPDPPNSKPRQGTSCCAEGGCFYGTDGLDPCPPSIST